MIKQQRDNIGKLIKKVSSRIPTEDLIAFVAANFGMLPASQKILDILSASDSFEREWLQEQCHNYHITSQTLQIESERILSLFQLGLSDDEQYSLLGLTSAATIAEVKSAFRKLSFRYHPDSSTTQDPDDSKKFIAICRAYKTIMRAHETQASILNNSESTPWHHDHNSQPPRQNRKAIFLIAGIVCILFLVSLSATRSYRKKAMLKSLGHSTQVAATTSQPQILNPQPLPETVKIVAANRPQPQNIPVSRTPETTKLPAIASVSKAVPTPPASPKTKPLAIDNLRSAPPLAASQPAAVPAPEISTVIEPAPKISTLREPVAAIASPVKPVSVAAPSPPEAPPLRNRIDSFLAAYTNAYELLDFKTFSTFFTADARENGVSFKEKDSKYRNLFAKLKEISYKITPRSWLETEDFITIKGRFHAYFLYQNGEESNIHGTTSLFLQEDRKKNLKVKTLTYTLD